MEENEKVEKGSLGIIIGILFTGFITGLFSGLSTKRGVILSLDSILIKYIGGFCSNIESYLNPGAIINMNSTCGINFGIVAIVLGICGIGEIIILAIKLKNWILGLILFGIGFCIGYLIA